MKQHEIYTVIFGCILCLSNLGCSTRKPFELLTEPSNDWGKIQWGKSLNGLQIGLVYWNEYDTKSSHSEDLLVELYFRNTGKETIHLMRPEPDPANPQDTRDPKIGLRFLAPKGTVYTALAFTITAKSKPSVMTIAPGETFKETGGVVMPSELSRPEENHGFKFPYSSPDKNPPILRVIGVIRFVYRNDLPNRDCFNPGVGPMVLRFNDMWTGSGESGSAQVTLRRHSDARPETIAGSRSILDLQQSEK